MLKKAIIIGSTGLIGKSLIELLLQSNEFSEVIALVRKPTNDKNKKVKFIETDFKDLSPIEQYLNGDVLFICIGSTMAKAGSKEAFLKIDYNIPVDVAHIANKKGVKSCIVVSSLGADAESANFYLQTKGKMEQAIEKIGFNNTVFMRPSLLFGAREEFRFGELIGKFFMKILGPLFLGPFKKYRGINAKTVALAMFNASLNNNSGVKKYESNEIEILAK
jgi:uncharacterized protein YbjT (DUF2867 family)